MTERPILMSAPMVLACLRDENPKTQTRRIVTPENIRLFMGDHLGCKKPSADLLAAAFEWAQDFRRFDGVQIWQAKAFAHQAPQMLTRWQGHSTYGVPGDVLWVREAWNLVPASAYRMSEGVQQTTNPADPDMAAIYAAGWDRSIPKWKPSIHMPRWACRLRLRITDVRMERLQDISEADALAEGIHDLVSPDGARGWNVKVDNRVIGNWISPRPQDVYSSLWEHINGEGSWDANPWIWAVTFERLSDNPR